MTWQAEGHIEAQAEAPRANKGYGLTNTLCQPVVLALQISVPE